MQVFKKTQIALAVGSALMVMAGSANAVNGVPAYRSPATSSALITQIDGGTANADVLSMLTAGGIVNTAITFDVALDSGAGATADGVVGAATAGVIGVVGGNPLAIGGADAAAAAAATNHLVIYTGTAATPTPVPSNGASATLGNTTDGVAHVTINLPAPGANKGYRINAGALEYSADTAAATPTWAAVKVLIRDVATKEIYAEEGTAGGFIAAADFELGTGIHLASVGTSLAPTPVVKTIGAPTAAAPLINGFAIDTIVPIDAFTIVTNVTVTPRNAGGIFETVAAETPFTAATALNTGTAFTATSATATLGTTVVATKTQPSSFKNTVTFLAAADWTDGAAADDSIFATSPLAFNTGVDGSQLPVTVAAVNAAPPKYTQVFNVADGLATTVTLPNATSGVVDAVAPVLVSGGVTFSTPSTPLIATDPSTTNLSLLFSENMSLIGEAGDLREILENVSVAGSTLGELSLNYGLEPTLAGFAAVGAQDKLTINNVATESVATKGTDGTWTGKSITIKPGISFKEFNDSGYVAGTDDLDNDAGTLGPNGEELAGGIESDTGVTEAIAEQSVTATAPDAAIAWGTNTSAEALPPSGDDTKISTIVVTFDTAVKLTPATTVFGTATTTAAKTEADLKNNLVVDVWGTNNVKFQVKPSAATLDTTGKKKITVTLPTALIYEKLAGASVQRVWIGYAAGGNNSTNNTLMGDALSASGKAVPVAGGLTSAANGEWSTPDLTAAGAEPVVLPLVFTTTATGGQSTLLTQSIKPTVVGASNNSIIRAYLARWADTPEADGNHVSVKHGIISKTDDKLANGLAIEFDDLNTLVGLIEDSLDAATPAVKAVAGVQNAAKAVAAANIPVYVKIVRSNDATANQQTGNQNYLYARAILSTDLEDLRTNNGNTTEETFDDNSPIYMAQLNPNTGDITGNLLKGKLTMDNFVVKGKRGLVFLDNNGQDTGSASNAQIGSALVKDGVLDLLMGIDPRSTDYTSVKLNTYKPFVLLVHESSTTDAEVTGKGVFTMLTSADPNAANYLPFTPDITNTAAQAARATVKLSLTDIKALLLPNSVNWALYGFGAPAEKQAGKSQLERMLVGLDTNSGLPASFWTEDNSDTDMAMALAGNKVGVATELKRIDGETSGVTLTNITAQNVVAGAAALAWSNDRGTIDGGNAVLGKIFVAQATGAFAPSKPAAAPKLPAGWSLVTVPADGSFDTANVDAIIKVGAQVGMGEGTDSRANSGAGTDQKSWFAEDGVNALPTLTAGDAVFVHAKKAGDL